MPSININCPKVDGPFGEMFYPGVEVGVKLSSGAYQVFEFILDSGADCTVVPHFMSDLVGFTLPKKADARMAGVAGIVMPCYKGVLSLRIQSEEFQVRCLFTESDKTPPLLGRVDLFNLFKVLFDGTGCTITLTRR